MGGGGLGVGVGVGGGWVSINVWESTNAEADVGSVDRRGGEESIQTVMLLVFACNHYGEYSTSMCRYPSN